jgi:ectoine hydroxylase-related dioxygenase (phytanoyl-CoA dioxygenase family)
MSCCLTLSASYHRVGTSNQFFQSNGGLSLLNSAAEREGIDPEQIEVISMAGLTAGGISIHNGNTWHGSGKNQSKTRPRRGLGLHFVPAHARFTEEARKSGLWRPYVADAEACSVELTEEDFPTTWKPI